MSKIMGYYFLDSVTKGYDFCLAGTLFLVGTIFLDFLLAHSGEASFHMKRSKWQEAEGGLLPTASVQLSFCSKVSEN